MLKDLGVLEIITFMGMENALRLIIMGLSREPNSELGLQNDLEERFLTSVPQEL